MCAIKRDPSSWQQYRTGANSQRSARPHRSGKDGSHYAITLGSDDPTSQPYLHSTRTTQLPPPRVRNPGRRRRVPSLEEMVTTTCGGRDTHSGSIPNRPAVLGTGGVVRCKSHLLQTSPRSMWGSSIENSWWPSVPSSRFSANPKE